MSNTLNPMKWKRSMNIKALLNVHNFKTKPPFDKWSIPYDRGIKTTGFVEKNDESSAVCRSFSEKPRRNYVH